LRYGVAAVTTWPRLTGVMDKEFAEAVDEAKTSVDVMHLDDGSSATGRLKTEIRYATLRRTKVKDPTVVRPFFSHYRRSLPRDTLSMSNVR